jgi:hypothetical protein
MDKSLQEKTGEELEEFGATIFKAIGLNCFDNLPQIRLNDIAQGYSEDAHIEFDYVLPVNKVCLIGEITGRDGERDIKRKYDKFIKSFNIIKDKEVLGELWRKLGIKENNLREFRQIEIIKGFFITTTKDRFDFTLSNVGDIVVFYKSDFKRLQYYSQSIGKWTKYYFLNNFSIETTSSSALTINKTNESLIRIPNIKISSKDDLLSDLYTFTTLNLKRIGIRNYLVLIFRNCLTKRY